MLRVTGTGFTATARAIDWGVGGGGFDIADASNTFRLGQTLSGGGSFTKAGAGTLIFTGSNNYTGGTTISGGTTGSATSNVANNGVLVFNRSNDLILEGEISGFGGIRQKGSGRTELTGDSSGFAGATSVDGGILAVNGKLGGTLDIQAAGRLQVRARSATRPSRAPPRPAAPSARSTLPAHHPQCRFDLRGRGQRGWAVRQDRRDGNSHDQ